jgi:hypothetical protein
LFLLYLKLTVAGFLGGLILVCNPSLEMQPQGVGLLLMGGLSLYLLIRSTGNDAPKPKVARPGPTFSQDDPSIVGVPPTTTTHLLRTARRGRQRGNGREE